LTRFLTLMKSLSSPTRSDSKDPLNTMVVRSALEDEELFIVDVACCSSSDVVPCPLSTDFDDVSDSPSPASEQRIRSAALNVYLLSFVQFINLLFIYSWLALSPRRSHFVLAAEVLLCLTPLSGVFGAYFLSRVWLEAFHMSSMLMFCSPLFFAMTVWDIDNLSALGCAFVAYQILLLFYQYKALQVVLQFRRDLKLRSLRQSFTKA